MRRRFLPRSGRFFKINLYYSSTQVADFDREAVEICNNELILSIFGVIFIVLKFHNFEINVPGFNLVLKFSVPDFNLVLRFSVPDFNSVLRFSVSISI